MSLVLQSSGGGSVTIQEPVTASNLTATLPAATGTVMVSGNMPAFSAYLNANQLISSATFTKITLDIETFDTNNNFASSRFTPTVAGYYQVNFAFSCAPSTSQTRVIGFIYKNGSLYAQGNDSVPFVPAGGLSVGGALIYLNGATDYIELYGYIVASIPLVSGGSSYTFMTGSLVRVA